jgi:Tol biopolymer transport system component
MSFRICAIVPCALILSVISGCARGTAAGEAAGNAEGNASISRLSDLAIAPATRRLFASKGWFNDWVNNEVRPSPDGRYVSMTDWSTGDLALRDLVSDSTLRLTRKGSWNDSSDFAETSLISPDGKTIAYGWYSNSRISFDIMVMSLSGADSGSARAIYRGRPLSFTAVQAWTPDSRNVIAVIEDSSTYIANVSVDGKGVRRIKTFESGFPDNLAVSPDAEWLAYDIESDDATGRRNVLLSSLDGQSESVISNEKENDFVVGWTRDGSRLLYGSERDGTTGVWAVSIARGKRIGARVLVRSAVPRMYPLGAMKTGRILYGVNTGTSDVFLASMDPATGELTSRPVAMNTPSNASSLSLAWSPDGRHLASIVARGGMINGGPSDLVIRSVDGGELRRLSPRMRRILHVYWPNDGSSLIVRGTDMKGKWGIYAVNLKTADLTTIMQGTEPGFGRSLSFSPDGRIGYFVSADSAFRKFLIIRLDRATNVRQVLYTIDAPQQVNALAISPDGHQLAIAIRGGTNGNGIVALLPAAGGVPREIFRFGDSEFLGNTPTPLTWSREGKELVLLVTTAEPANARSDVRALSLDGKLRSLRIPGVQIATLRISPDSRRIAMFMHNLSSELWTMDEPVFASDRATRDRR